MHVRAQNIHAHDISSLTSTPQLHKRMAPNSMGQMFREFQLKVHPLQGLLGVDAQVLPVYRTVGRRVVFTPDRRSAGSL